MKKFFIITILMGIGISVWAHDVKIETVNKDVVIENPKNVKLTDAEKEKIKDAIKDAIMKKNLHYGDATIVSDKKPFGDRPSKDQKKTQLSLKEVQITQITEGNDEGRDKNKFFATSTCTTEINGQDWNLEIKWKGIGIKAKKEINPNPKSFTFTKIKKQEDTQKILADAKNAAITELNNLVSQQGLSEDVTIKIKTVVSEAKTKINKANDEKAINGIKNECKSAVERIKNDAEAAARKQEDKPEQAPAPVVQQPNLQQADDVANNFRTALSEYATNPSANKSKLEGMFVKNAEVQVSNLTAGTKTEKVGQYLSNLKAKNAKQMVITLKAPENRNNGNEVVYPYAQHFESDTYCDHTDKKLHLKKDGETYKITKIDVVKTSECK